MAFTVRVKFVDGSHRSVGRVFRDVASASHFALRLADDLGRTYTIYRAEGGKPVAVAICGRRRSIFEITVFDGGLSPEPAFSGPVDLPE